MNKQQLIVELQSTGLKLATTEIGSTGRIGGAGPSDRKAVTLEGTTVMVSVFNSPAAKSPYIIVSSSGEQRLQLNGRDIGAVSFPQTPKFYSLTTSDGIALLRSNDVLATTVLQTCIRYGDPATSCQTILYSP